MFGIGARSNRLNVPVLRESPVEHDRDGTGKQGGAFTRSAAYTPV